MDRLRAVLSTAAAARVSLRALDDPLFVSQAADDSAWGAAGREHADAAGHPQSGLEAHWRRRPYAANLRPAWRNHRAALLPAFHHRSSGPGLVRQRAAQAGHDALPAVRALEPGLHAGAVELSGAGGALLRHANAGLRLVSRLRGFRSVLRIHGGEAGEETGCQPAVGLAGDPPAPRYSPACLGPSVGLRLLALA